MSDPTNIEVRVDLSPFQSRAFWTAFKRKVATMLQRQVQDRIRNGGDDEITFQPLARPRADGSGSSPLYHTGSHLHDFIGGDFDRTSVWVDAGWPEGADGGGHPPRMLQLGTTGRGGKLPPIKPVRARALFIPLTPKAAMMTRRERVGEGGGAGLVKGKDFIFRSKVEIPPRPFLRLSKKNVTEIGSLFTAKRTGGTQQ